jgi:hypothetical protein
MMTNVAKNGNLTCVDAAKEEHLNPFMTNFIAFPTHL